MRALRRFLPLVLLASLAPSSLADVDPAKDIRSKDVKKRLAAVEVLRAQGGERAEELLLDALKDRDWEVVDRAIAALAERGGAESIKDLADLAVGAPARRLRLAAAAVLARLDPEQGAKRVSKDLRGEQALRAAEAISVLVRDAGGKGGEELAKAAEKAVKAKEPLVRAAAAGAVEALPAEERAERIRRLAQDEDLVVVCSTLDELARRAEGAHMPLLLERLSQETVNDVVERRIAAAVLAIVKREGAVPETGEKQVATRTAEVAAGLAVAKDPKVAARFVRLVEALVAPPTTRPAEPKAPDAPPAAPPAAPKEGDPPAPKGDPPAPPKEGDAPAPAAEAEPRGLVGPDAALEALGPALGHKSEDVRAAAAHVLAHVRTPAGFDRARALVAKDPNPRVRFQAMLALRAHRGALDDAVFQALAERLTQDEDALVREQAAVLLGVSRPNKAPFDEAVPLLDKALADAQWNVSASAAVSLGKTRSPRAVEPLARQLDGKAVKDWRRRGAAVVGLGTLQRKEAVPHVISALGDKDPYVRRTAFEYLRRMTKRTINANAEDWSAWWAKSGPTYEWIDHDKVAREAKKGGYAVTPVEVYDAVGTAKMDVVVLQTRKGGDRIEELLEKLGIAHRITRAAALGEAELHPFAAFVANCPGEILPEDAERLQWFVRVGGYLFCSCWALTHTAGLVYPGPVRKLGTLAQVVDNVIAERCPGDSPFLDGVFPGFTRPMFNLEGAHIIEVLQPERVEMLVDSPASANRWGGGNMACWFSAGHGVILDSANHFQGQGMSHIIGLKTADDRMAFAMDHMGMDYADVRALAEAKVWESHSDAVREATDMSVFRLITNFVRLKRRMEFQ